MVSTLWGSCKLFLLKPSVSLGLFVALGVVLPIMDALRASMRSNARLGTALVVSDVAALEGSALDARLAALTMLLRLAAEMGG